DNPLELRENNRGTGPFSPLLGLLSCLATYWLVNTGALYTTHSDRIGDHFSLFGLRPRAPPNQIHRLLKENKLATGVPVAKFIGGPTGLKILGAEAHELRFRSLMLVFCRSWIVFVSFRSVRGLMTFSPFLKCRMAHSATLDRREISLVENC